MGIQSCCQVWIRWGVELRRLGTIWGAPVSLALGRKACPLQGFRTPGPGPVSFSRCAAGGGPGRCALSLVQLVKVDA